MADPLQKLKSEIQYDKVTVSFSIEGRDANGLKKFILNTFSVGKVGGGSWTPAELPVIHGLVSKQVVVATYKDALHRGAISGGTFKSEVTAILKATDQQIAKHLEKRLGEDEDGSQTGTEDLR